MLMHAAINNTKDLVPSIVRTAANPFALSTSRTAWLGAALLWVAAAYFLVRMRRVTGLAAPGAVGPANSDRDSPIPGRQAR
jgi:hypothetical protein